MSNYPTRNECISILKKAGCRPKIIVHCKTVEAVASEISKIIDCDRQLVTAGALLHDLGRARDHTIMHAYIGSQMAHELGLPDEIIDIIRKHTGAGLDDRDVKEMGLPYGDYIPKTIEEKIVAHADNMVSGDTVVSHMHTVTKLTEKGSLRGARRVEDLHAELSRLYGDDLDNIIFKTGVKPCANYNNL